MTDKFDRDVYQLHAELIIIHGFLTIIEIIVIIICSGKVI